MARAEREFVAPVPEETFGGRTIDELATDIANRKKTIDANYLQSRYALSSDQALQVIAQLLERNVIALDGTHHDDEMQTVYCVLSDNLSVE